MGKLEKGLLDEVILSKKTYDNFKKKSIDELERQLYLPLAELLHELSYRLYFYYLNRLVK